MKRVEYVTDKKATDASAVGKYLCTYPVPAIVAPKTRISLSNVKLDESEVRKHHLLLAGLYGLKKNLSFVRNDVDDAMAKIGTSMGNVKVFGVQR